MTVAISPRVFGLDVRGRAPGVVAAAALALAAQWIANGLGDPLARNPVLVAMLFALALGSIFECPPVLRPGLDFTKRLLLRLAVILLGFRVTVSLLENLGLVPITIAAIELAAALILVRWFARRVLKLDPSLALLVAVGSSVCGAAAILSVASLDPAREKHAGTAITVITVSGTVALLLFPMAFLGGWMPGIDERGFGITVGASIFELAQVYGASFAVSEGALNVATLVKLSKVVMLVPLLLLLGLRNAGDPQKRRKLAIPWFVVGFLAVLVLNSSTTLHPQLRSAILQADQFLFLMVMIALGLTTSLSRLRQAGDAMRLLAVGLVAVLLTASLAFAMVRACGHLGLVAAPSSALAQRGATDTAARGTPATGAPARGLRLFDSTGCAKCHVSALQGSNGAVMLYSDLLLHDMGASLDDKIVQGQAGGADWRTTPLVGLGSRERYLHDGRATSLRAALLDHGGEAEIVRNRFFELDESEQQEIYRFLSSL